MRKNVSWAFSSANEFFDIFYAFLYIQSFSDIQMNGFCNEAYEDYDIKFGFSLVLSVWHWTGEIYAHVIEW